MVGIAIELVQDLVVHILEVIAVDVVAAIGPRGQVLDFALEVEDAVFAGADGIIAKVFGQAARVFRTIGFAVAKPQVAAFA